MKITAKDHIKNDTASGASSIEYGSVEDFRTNDVNDDDRSLMMIMTSSLRRYGGRIATTATVAVLAGCATFRSNTSFAIKNSPSIAAVTPNLNSFLNSNLNPSVFHPSTDTCFRNSANVYCWSRGSDYTGCKPQGTEWTETNGHTQAGSPYCGDDGGSLCRVFAIDTICACNYKCNKPCVDVSPCVLIDLVKGCQKGCQVAHLGKSINDCGDEFCTTGWNYFNQDDHNGGSGVTIYDDDIN